MRDFFYLEKSFREWKKKSLKLSLKNQLPPCTALAERFSKII